LLVVVAQAVPGITQVRGQLVALAGFLAVEEVVAAEAHPQAALVVQAVVAA
jgi:hypothetical protein